MTYPDVHRYGPWALVTGAARGIGAAYAERLAEDGLSLVLVDVLDDALEARAQTLRERYGVKVEALTCDLRAPDFFDALSPRLEDREIGMLVCNAALSDIGAFMNTPLEDLFDMLWVNCRATLVLTRRLGEPMCARGRGGIVIMASMSALTGAPFTAHYAATKAYAHTLAESLWEELRPRGVDVLGVLPGPVATEGFDSHDPVVGGLVKRMMVAPEVVVDEALGALGKRPSLVPGRLSRFAAFLTSRLAPRHTVITSTRKNMEELYPDRTKG